MTSKLILFAGFIISMLLMSVNHRKKRKKIIFFGDSLCRQGATAGGFIIQMLRLLKAEALEDSYDLVSAGVDGDKVYDLFLRIDEDILNNGADIVVIFIGLNDVEHKRYRRTGTDAGRFEAFYEAIIKRLKDARIKPVLCTPPVIGEKINGCNEDDHELDVYCGIIRNLAAENDLALVDVRKCFVNYLNENNPENVEQGVLTVDKIHLNPKGNQLVAEEMWKVLKDIK